MDYGLLRQYTGNGMGLSMGSLRGALDEASIQVIGWDRGRVLASQRRRTLAAAIVMVQFRAEYSHLETRIKAGDGADEALWFDVEDRQSDRTPMGELTNLTGARTLLADVEAIERMGAEVFVREVIAGNF